MFAFDISYGNSVVFWVVHGDVNLCHRLKYERSVVESLKLAFLNELNVASLINFKIVVMSILSHPHLFPSRCSQTLPLFAKQSDLEVELQYFRGEGEQQLQS